MALYQNQFIRMGSNQPGLRDDDGDIFQYACAPEPRQNQQIANARRPAPPAASEDEQLFNEMWTERAEPPRSMRHRSQWD
jgi:hypothetical protein